MVSSCSDYVEMRLEEWSRWANKNYDNIGYSSISNLGLIMLYGGVIVKATGQRRIEDHPQAEEMEKWIAQLSIEHPKEAEAITEYYLNKDKYSLPISMIKEKIAKRLSVTSRMLNHRIEKGRLWLEGKVSNKIIYA